MDIKKPPKSSSARDPEVKTFTDALEKILSASGPTVPATRKELKETAEKLSLALETPGETVQRVAYYPMRTSIVHIANKLHLFHILVDSNRPVTAKEVAQKAGADHILLLRLLRYLVAMHAIGEAGVDTYIPNNVTKNLIIPKLEAGISHTYDIAGAAVMALVDRYDKCKLILSHLASAMTPGYSKILLNELVLPDKGCGIIAAQVDIAMMACCASEERSERQWHQLVGSAGLKIENIWTDVPEAESIIELVLE